MTQRHFALIALVFSATIAAVPAHAADDHNGATQIIRGDFVAAESVITAATRVTPNDPDLMLNMAMVYRHTGRASEARALYRAVLSRPDEIMELPDGTARSAHVIATGALGAMTGAQLVAR